MVLDNNYKEKVAQIATRIVGEFLHRRYNMTLSEIQREIKSYWNQDTQSALRAAIYYGIEQLEIRFVKEFQERNSYCAHTNCPFRYMDQETSGLSSTSSIEEPSAEASAE